MTDLEMTKLCAEAMDLKVEWRVTSQTKIGPKLKVINEVVEPFIGEDRYEPLYNDEQAMDLITKFRLHLNCNDAGSWWVLGRYSEGKSEDLKRAVVECVSRMQRQK